MDPYKILDDQYQQQLVSVENMFGEQEKAIRQQAAEQYDMLTERYNLERRYLERTPMDWQQQRAKIQDLNKKYEIKALELDQKVRPFFHEIEAKKAQVTAKLDQGRMQRQARLQLIDELVQNGTIQRPEAAIKEQMQTLGLPVSLTDLIGVSREAKIDDLRGEISAIDSILGRFKPPIGKRGKLQFDRIGRGYDDDYVDATDEQLGQYAQLQNKRIEQVRQLSNLLTQKQQERPGLYSFSGPADRVGMRRSGNVGTFQNQAAQLMPQQGKQVTRELVQSLAAQGLNRQQAEQWLRENGYNVRS